jgi:anthranilate synthase component 1
VPGTHASRLLRVSLVTSFDAFRAMAAPGRLVPVWHDCLLDLDTPVSAFAKLRRGPFAFLLESAPAGSETWARYTFLGTEPRAAWRLTDGAVDRWTPSAGWHGAERVADPFESLRAEVSRYEPVVVPELGDFWAGAVGFFSYDVVRHIEHLPYAPPRGTATPDALFVSTRTLVVMDNLKSQARVVTAVPIDADDEATLRVAYDAAVEEIRETIARLQSPATLAPLMLDDSAPIAEGRSNFTREAFDAAVQRIKEYIVAGDCFQCLIARRITVPHDFDGLTLYRAIRALNPSPYMYHLVLDGMELVGSSPEVLVRLANGTITVRPIAGTRRRGSTPADDARLTEELQHDEKERAEHVMLVDLGRNDVGRLAKFGTVRVTDFMTVERYSHVLHLVSQVTGEVGPDASALDVVRATFPAGTMTGAPKVRAMQIIDELEPERRGPYAGAVGYLAAGDRRMDLAITIRTCVIAAGEASVQVGAGIVYDSVPAHEWLETEHKSRAMLTAIGRVRAPR